MNTVRPNGAAPQFSSIHDAGAQAPLGQPAKAPAPQVPLQLEPQDLVTQTAGERGRAAPVAIVGGPQAERIRALLASKDFDGIVALVNQLGINGIGKPDLSLDDIKAIASGLGQDQTFARYTGEERQAVEALLRASQLSPNEKVYGLKTLNGPEAVLSYVRSAPASELKSLSMTNRQMLLTVLDPGSSIWGTIQGAANEAILRRGNGESQQIEDRFASKILRSARNEQEVRELLEKINQFNRDDVAFRYVMDLSAEELAGMSDSLKQELLSQLVDTGVSLPFGFNLDLNSVANFDETLGMTFKQHAQAARRLYVALSPASRQSAEVQTLVAKSDDLMQQLTQIESSLQQDLKAGKLNQEKISAYRSQLEGLKTQYANQPDVQAKVAALLGTLSQLQEGLSQASRTRVDGITQLKQAGTQLSQTQTSLKNAQTQVQQLEQKLKTQASQLDQSEAKLLGQLRQLAGLREQSAELGSELTSLLAEAEQLQSGSLRGKLPQLDQLLSRLAQAESRLAGLGPEQAQIRAQLSQLRGQMQSQRQELTQASQSFNQDRQQLQTQQQSLERLLSTYSGQIAKLESDYATGRTQIDALDQSALPEAERAQLQADLDAIRHEIDGHQASHLQLQTGLSQTVVPAARQIEAAAAALEPRFEAAVQTLDQASAQLEALVDVQATVDTEAEQLRQALEQQRSAAQTLVADITKNLGGMNSKALGVARDQIQQMLSQLQSTAPSADTFQAELNGLNGLLSQIGEIEQALNNSKDLEKTVKDILKQVEAQKASMDAELSDARSAMSQAEREVTQAQKSVEQTQKQLQDLGKSLDSYEAEIKTWEKRLADLDQKNADSRGSFLNTVEPLKTGLGQAPNAIDPALKAKVEREHALMLDSFKGVDAQRQAIEAKLRELKTASASTQTKLSEQRSQLVDYQSTLTQKQTALDNTRTQLEGLSIKLESVIANNQSLLEENETLLKQWQGKQPKNSQVAASLQKARKQCEALKNQLGATRTLAEQTNTQIESLKTLSQSTTTVQESLVEGLSGIDGFVTEKLQPMQSSLSNYEQRFNTLNLEKARLKSQLDDLYARKNQGSISIEEFGQGLEAIFTQAKDSGTLTLLSEAGAQLIGASQDLAEADQAISQNDDFNAQAGQIRARAERDVDQMLALVDQLRAETGQMEQEVGAARIGLLEIQRSLLAQRRQLGISHPEYQSALERYAQLLNSGQPLSDRQVAELQGLERQLQSIEAEQAQTDQALSDRITSLNTLKTRVNDRIDALNGKIAVLETRRAELLEIQAKLQGSRDTLVEHRGRLVQRRDSLQELIQRIKSNPGSLGFTNVAQRLAELEARLAEINSRLEKIDGSIAASDQTLTELASTIERIDQALVEAKSIKAKLELVQGKIAELLEQAEQLQGQLADLAKQVGDLRANLTELKQDIARVAETTGASPSQSGPQSAASQAGESELAHIEQQRRDMSKQSFSQRLSNQLTSFWSASRRQQDSKREAEHQAQRDELLKDLEQRLQLSRQYQTDLADQIVRQQGLEEVTEQLVSQARLGLNPTTGLNIV